MKLPPLPAYQPYARTQQQPPPPPYMVTTMNHHHHPYQHSSPPPTFHSPPPPPPNHHQHPVYARTHSSSSAYPTKRIVLNPQLLVIVVFFLITCLFIANSLPPANNNNSSNNDLPIQYPNSNRGLRTIYGTEECNVLLETERRIKEDLMEQIRRLEADASELRLKNRELESDYRELSLSARAAAVATPQQQNHNNKPMEDVSAVQRLAKCRSSLEESSSLIRELRDGNKQVNSQVTRLQKELREAIADADEQEAIAVACQKKTKL